MQPWFHGVLFERQQPSLGSTAAFVWATLLVMHQLIFITTTALALLGGCASSPKPVKDASLRHTAAGDLACPEDRLSEESVGSAVRVSGCGRSAMYSCKRTAAPGQTPNPHGIQTHEDGVKPFGVMPGPCSWVIDR